MSGQASTTAADLLIGAAAIASELKELGLLEEADEDKVYYTARMKKLPIGRYGKSLLASRTKLRNAARALTS
jgi:hypothetical protein